jgi:predicted short-subunit dehydrogenase-like oxidoreductase (DUF2520 family)
VKVWRDGGSRDSGRGTGAKDRGEAPGDPVEEGSGKRGRSGPEPGPREVAVGRHRHGDLIHAHVEPHPHQHGTEGAPTVGIVGAGPVGLALGLAISRARWPVTAVASRDAGRRDRFVSLVPTARAFIEPAAVLDEAELVLLCVPDDAIAAVADSIRLYSGQALAHTSGLLGAEVLEPARAAGSQIGAFHPLVSFTVDTERSVASIKTATIAVEGDDRLMGLLADLAEAIGGVPVRLPRGAKPAYHAAAVLASGGLAALLDAVVSLAAAAGMDERGALAVYGRLMEQTLANAKALGVNAALTGPIPRGDAGTVAAHVEVLRRHAPEALEVYLAVARRELQMAQQRRTLSPEQVERVAAALAKPA